MDDLTYLRRRHQQELAQANAATCQAARSVHEQLARLYADRISQCMATVVSFDRPNVRSIVSDAQLAMR